MVPVQRVTTQPRNGFTLVEVMVAVAILAIIGAIAVPLYESQSRKGKRADAMTSLERVAQAEQRYSSDVIPSQFLESLLDGSMPSELARYGVTSATSPGGYYNISVAPGATGSIASSFVATAVPLTDGQKKDVCQSFTLSNLGIRGATATGVSDAAAARLMCWGK